MSQLVKYEAACRAIAECKAVDEVKAWADKAAAMQAYGRMAKDKSLEVDAAEIRIRAERRLGQMIAEQKAGPGLNSGALLRGSSKEPRDERPTLADAGIDKKLSSRAQKLAAVPAAEFEAEVGQWRDRVQAEGARGSARLVQAGERELAKQPEQPADDGPSAEELAFLEKQHQGDMEQIQRLLEADDALSVEVEENKRLRLMVQSLQRRIDGLMVENSELIREVKSLRRKFDKAAA